MTDTVRAAATGLPISSRRLFLAAGSAAAVFATVKRAAAAAPAVPVDPIFAAIEDHKLRDAEFLKTINPVDEILAEREGREVSRADEDAHHDACAYERMSLALLAETVPTTGKGIKAAIEYLASLDDYDVMGDFCKTLLLSPVLAHGGANV